MRARPFLVTLLLGSAASAAHATPIDDLYRGGDLSLNRGVVTMNGDTFQAQNFTLAKAPDTLHMRLNTLDFGLEFGLDVDLVGTPVGDTVHWNFGAHLPSGLHLGGEVWLTDYVGTLVTRVTRLDGAYNPLCAPSTPCPYSVRLTSLPGGRVFLNGTAPAFTTWSREVRVDTVDIFGGVPRPGLADLHLDGGARYCESDLPRGLTGRVSLTSPAATGGAWVDLRSSSPHAVPATGVFVPEGAHSATFRLTIPPGFNGALIMTAAAGGAVDRTTLTVRPRSECRIDIANVTSGLVASAFPIPVGVGVGFTQADMNARGDAIAVMNGQALVYSPEYGVAPLHEGLEAWKIQSARLNDWGQVAGTGIAPDGTVASFVVSSVLDEAPSLTVLPNVRVHDISDLGTVVGRDTQGQPGFFNGQGLVSIELDGINAGFNPATFGVNELGIFGINHEVPGGRRAAVYHRREHALIDVGDLGGDVTGVAINADGDLAGVARRSNGTEVPFYYERSKARLVDIGLLPGCAEGRATSINDAGWVVGNMTKKNGKRTAFLYVPDKGARDLQSMLPYSTNIVVQEALRITRDGQILARALVGGEETVVLLELGF
jgi:probable HAF family extracellular repeat protein